MRPTDVPADEARGEIDLDLGNLKLRLQFRTSTYRLLEKLTGVSHFKRLSSGAPDFDLDTVALCIFAASRKYHAVDAHVSQEAVYEALDGLSGYDSLQVFGKVVRAFSQSVNPPSPLPPSGPAPQTGTPASP